jgi:lipopolysaccharide assembly outer membrane protein LptD (OstA)
MFDSNKNKLHTNRHRIFLFSVLCLFGFCLLAQVQPRRGAQPAKSKVYLLHADLLQKNKDNPDAQILIGDVEFRHDSIYMYCDTAYFYEKANSLEAFGNFRMEQADTLKLFGDYAYYD